MSIHTPSQKSAVIRPVPHSAYNISVKQWVGRQFMSGMLNFIKVLAVLVIVGVIAWYVINFLLQLFFKVFVVTLNLHNILSFEVVGSAYNRV